MLSHALFASFSDTSENRVSDRLALRLEARMAMPAGESGIEVHNLSRTGMLVESTIDLPIGTELDIELPGGKSHRAEVVWADEGLFGCRFESLLPQAVLSAALLRAAPQTLETPEAAMSQEEAMARLREHWSFEHELPPATDRKLPIGTRMWIIGGLGLTGWAVPAAAAWVFW